MPVNRDYVKDCNAGRLTQELITAGFAQYPSGGYKFYGVSVFSPAPLTTVIVIDSLSGGDATTIDGIVAAHINTPLTADVTPQGHAPSHKLNGSDEIDLDELGLPSDITNLNSSTTAHGLLPKLSGSASDVLKGNGSFGTIVGSGEANTASNVGTAGKGVFDAKVGVDLQFRKLNAVSNITIEEDITNQKIDFTGPTPGETNTASNVGTAGKGVFDGKVGVDLRFRKLNAVSNITIDEDITNKKIDFTGPTPGESNTASNVGSEGVGVFKDKSGVDLRFKKLNPISNITIVEDITNQKIDFTGSTPGEANTASNFGSSGIGVFKDKAGADLRFKKLSSNNIRLTIEEDATNGEIDANLNIPTRRIVYVDIIYGNDDTAIKYDITRPYQSVNAAITALTAGDIVKIYPGTYDISPFTLPSSTSLIGSGRDRTLLRSLNAGSSKTLITTNVANHLADFTLQTTSAASVTLIGILGHTDGSDAIITGVTISLSQTTAANGKSYGVLHQGSGEMVLYNCSIIAQANTATAIGRGLLTNTAAGTISAYGCNITAPSALGSNIGAESNFAGSTINLTGCVVNGTTADISQTLGTVRCTGTYLKTNSCNALAFETGGPSAIGIWSHIGAVTSGATRYLYPGAGTNSTLIISATISKPCIFKKLRLVCTTAPGGSDTTAITCQKNTGGGAVDTALTATLSGAGQTASDLTHAVSFAAGDHVSFKIVTSSVLNTTDPVATVEIY